MQTYGLERFPLSTAMIVAAAASKKRAAEEVRGCSHGYWVDNPDSGARFNSTAD